MWRSKMSTPFCFAVGLYSGGACLEQFEKKYFEDEEILQLTKKVTVRSDPYFDKNFPKIRGAKIELHLNSGKTESKTIDLPKGEPETPMTYLEIKNKLFNSMSLLGIEKEKAKLIFSSCVKDKLELSFLLEAIQELQLLNERNERK